MLGNFNESAKKVLLHAGMEMKELRHPYIGSEHLLLSILKSKNEVSKKLNEYNLNYKTFKKELIDIVGTGTKESPFILYTPLLKRVIENAVLDSKENNQEVTIENLFASLLEEGEGVAIRIMIGMNINLDELYSAFSCKVNTLKSKKSLLEEMGINLTQKAFNKELDPVIGRNEEINRVLEIILRRSKNNPILVGEAGVGKTAIVEGLANLISEGNVPINLKNKKIISLEMASLVAGTKYRGEFEERIKQVLNEVAESDDIILFIDEIHTIIGAGGAEGAIDASNIFKPSLARGKLRLIGATTEEEYRKTIEKDKALDRRFQKVLVSEPNAKATREIIMNLKPIYESYHHVKISNDVLNFLIETTHKYVFNRKNPDKTIDILDEVCSKVSLKENKTFTKYNVLLKNMQKIVEDKKKAIINSKFKKASKLKEEENELMNKINILELKLYTKNIKSVHKKDVLKVIAHKSNIPYQILSNSSVLFNLENKLNQKIYGQEQAIHKFCKQLQNNQKVFSLEGPAGVGKNYLVELLSEYLGYKIIKIDLLQYQNINKIIGATAGYIGYDDKTILDEIKNNPYTIVLLENVESGKEEILNLFLNGFKEKTIIDNKGSKINLSNALLIQLINSKTKIGFNDLVNSSNNIIFANLTREILEKILSKKRMSSKRKEDIIERSEFQKYGAEKLQDLIQEKQFT